MGVSKISDSDLFPKLNEIFRKHGYEGASLSLLSERTGLGRASLYHRFPGGKNQIVESLLKYVEDECMPLMLAPLNEAGAPIERLRLVASRIEEFYEGGQCWCLFDTLSLGTMEHSFHSTIQRLFKSWVDAFTAVAIESGMSAEAGRLAAEDALVRIQGTLVYARASGDRGPFLRTIRDLPSLLCAAPAPAWRASRKASGGHRQ